ncbi:GNAT family N-acetyltransferase [Roseomonas sp. SSH11]|uniref:GNAT family N-acetyltransferase n=1 Tax=Pararoseomonas baculiformis TaxID=2820812 RepID=A0ABS4AGI9_9PROT|nr:GNAT family N-acetyltransferase [Pararoseomonas baculiformis]MBP0445643.1 GNAT family N-acetyltransferase [Pararoseomonas baculiformis]
MPEPEHRIQTVAGEALRPHLAAVARLRAVVFRDWPYLYDAAEDYEARYLRAYSESPGAAVILALAGEEPVGAATCQPMQEAGRAVLEAAAAAGMDPTNTCYFGESVLLPEWRGRGIGVAFFAAREAHARALGLRRAAFCAVRRDAADPRRPATHQPLDAFWHKRGYAPVPGMAATMEWREVGGTAEIPHRLDFWARDLA